MPMFSDFLSGLRDPESGALTIGENFEADATAAYDADMNGANAAFEQAMAENAELKLQLQAAQAANWILVQDGYGLDGSGPGEGATESDPENAETDGDADPDDIDDDDFLGTNDDKDND